MTFVPIKGDGLNPLLYEDLEKLRFPLIASPKLDGIRALVRNGDLWTYRLKLVPNIHTRKLFRHMEGVDGELIAYGDGKQFRDTSSAVMTRTGKPVIAFNLFDIHDEPDMPFHRRLKVLKKRWAKYDNSESLLVPQWEISSLADLKEIENATVEEGYEGLIVRDPDGPYKYGRSTIKEGYLIKLKREYQEEAIVIGYTERMKNNNEQTRDEHGRAKRSSHKANKTGHGDLGTLVVRSEKYYKDFEVGSGFTAAERADLWKRRKKLIGKMVTFKFNEKGDYDVPRFPVFHGFRDRRD